ncbi:hypothetical protein ABFX02_03G023200 [Erythranthe guttata]
MIFGRRNNLKFEYFLLIPAFLFLSKIDGGCPPMVAFVCILVPSSAKDGLVQLDLRLSLINGRHDGGR